MEKLVNALLSGFCFKVGSSVWIIHHHCHVSNSTDELVTNFIGSQLKEDFKEE